MYSRIGLSVLLLFMASICMAIEPTKVTPQAFFFPVEAPQASFVFSGMVSDETGDSYHYFFQIQRDGKLFHAQVALLDSQTKQSIFTEDTKAELDTVDDYDWHIGRAFLRFNAINDSWIFGLQDHQHGGFNFKVDMLNQREEHNVTRYSRHGISFVVMQTGAVDGHLQLSSHEAHFVMGKTAWFRQIWLTRPALDVETHQLDGLLCRFQQGGGLYSVRLSALDNTLGMVSGLLDQEGQSLAISQFIHVEARDDQAWLIRVPSPSMQLQVHPLLQQPSLVAGFMMNKDLPGFCLLSRERMGLAEATQPISKPKPNTLAKSARLTDKLLRCNQLWC